MNSTPHPTPLQIPEHQEVLLNKMEKVDQNVLDLHPLLHLLNKPEDGRESLGDRLAALLLGVKDALERNTAEMTEIADRLHRMEQQLTQVSRVLNLNPCHARRWACLSLGEPHAALSQNCPR